jgi:selenide,water dikinase
METSNTQQQVKLTSYSHGAGCGCKISPSVLDRILSGPDISENFNDLLVGNRTRDDAAILKLNDSMALISTTDFFMPIVDDPFDFGRIAATNAISDIYAMGGKPNLAIAILGWPIDKIAPEVAAKVVEGGRFACNEAGIPLGGGHSIDSPEPIFGLAVNGIINPAMIKKNSNVMAGDNLFLTKSLGTGILTTAMKKGMLQQPDLEIAVESMTTLNKVGALCAEKSYVNAMTDVTGFGLLGHLTEMISPGGFGAEIDFSKVPIFSNVTYYLEAGAVPGGTKRNLASYGSRIICDDGLLLQILADPQTSGGLLIAVSDEGVEDFIRLMRSEGISQALKPIGRIIEGTERAEVKVVN